ncbi:MAG TPA: hypothetical protein VHK91_17805 [Flavisolibacter sp.]|jgi:hypothetical protein|nr:hypothetical protein [Flavisolibacter sp.]
MNKELERLDFKSLLDLYMSESESFSTALGSGASWMELQDRRSRIREISTLISRKYDQVYNVERQRHRPPHGD